ncbi:MAG: hypothetical protein ICV69_11275 [Thermoleophilaceae bacterium]|nr:hypothetical protein [Thermoleophilaceae bacterium]
MPLRGDLHSTGAPGITVNQIAKELAVDATSLYRPAHKLEQERAISKQGRTLQPTGR